MPELSDDFYCSEQICIPPTFPYLLRQFAKAAIRTQPSDLLKWSTAYFRCLSLNIPPPVKPRLEYPIPKDFYGLTPGWLKALIYQLQGNNFVSFKILWDRWIGACLEHKNLIQILVLGGFTNPFEIDFLKFIALCAGHVTENLTNTMILICEVLTEEPEGGSAIIPLETFLNLYRYLAAIEASKPQVLKNLYFTDDYLEIWKERAAKQEKIEEKEESIEEEEKELTISEEEIVEEEVEKHDLSEVVSCPSIKSDEEIVEPDNAINPNIEDYLGEGQSANEEEFENIEHIGEKPSRESTTGENSDEKTDDNKTVNSEEDKEPGQSEEKKAVHIMDQMQEDIQTAIEAIEKPSNITTASKQESINKQDDNSEPPQIDDLKNINDDKKENEDETQDKKEAEAGIVLPQVSQDTIIEEPRKLIMDEETILAEDLERLKILQMEAAGETDEEVEKFKCRLMGEMPMETGPLIVDHYGKTDDLITSSSEKSEQSQAETTKPKEDDKSKYEDVFIEAIPGIGPAVPEEMVTVVEKYLRTMAKEQHGMVMPRNIKHFNCPPLEKFS